MMLLKLKRLCLWRQLKTCRLPTFGATNYCFGYWSSAQGNDRVNNDIAVSCWQLSWYSFLWSGQCSLLLPPATAPAVLKRLYLKRRRFSSTFWTYIYWWNSVPPLTTFEKDQSWIFALKPVTRFDKFEASHAVCFTNSPSLRLENIL